MSPSAPHRQQDCSDQAFPGSVLPDQRPQPQRTRAYAGLHALYKSAVSPVLHSAGLAAGFAPGGCRFQPTCSEYAALAFAQYGLARGLRLTLTRLLRCHPFSRGGWDPVPFTDAAPPEVPPKGTIEAGLSTHDPL